MLPWVSKGHLPNFSRIFGQGSSGELYSAIPVTPVAWSSIYTGLNPGRHGVLGFKNHKQGTYKDFAVNSTIRDGRDVWDLAGSAGKKVVVVNAPLTYPPRPVNGSLVCGFMAPGTDHVFTYPESLGSELKGVVPGYRIGTAPTHLKGLYRRELIRTVEMVGDAAVHLMKKIDWDLSFVVFKETDEVQHTFYDQPESMLMLYKRVDAIVGDLLDIAGESACAFVVSDHGGEPFEKRFNVAEFLRRSGYVRLRPAKASLTTSVFRTAARLISSARLQWAFDVPGAKRLMEGLIKARVSSLGPNAGDDFYSGRIDWPRTTAFISSGVGLRLNLKGREPEGSVDPQEYESVRSSIALQLTALKDPENGHAVFKYALPREKVLSGPHVKEAPDIMCLPGTGYLPTEALTSFDPLSLTTSGGSLFSRTSPWSGTHSPYGLVAIRGPGVKKSTIMGAKLEDIAPTILYALGLPVPKGLDGRVMLDVFDQEHVNANPVSWGTAETPDMKAAPRQLSREEEAVVEERLRQLGYLS